jgi:hypothetical protein
MRAQRVPGEKPSKLRLNESTTKIKIIRPF